MAIGNSSNIDNAIRTARPLSLLAGERPEFADVERIWETELAPELGVREAIRKQTISRAKSRTFLGLLVAVPGALFIMVLSGGAPTGATIGAPGKEDRPRWSPAISSYSETLPLEMFDSERFD